MEVFHGTATKLVCIEGLEAYRVFVPGYSGRWLHLTVYTVNAYQGQ